MPGASSEPWYKTYRNALVIIVGLAAAVAVGYYVWPTYGYSFDTSSLLKDEKTGEVIRDFQSLDQTRTDEHNRLIALKTQKVDGPGWEAKAAGLTKEWKQKVDAAKTEHGKTWSSTFGYKMKEAPERLPGMPEELTNADVLKPGFEFTAKMAKDNFEAISKNTLEKDESLNATITEKHNDAKKAHDDFYGENTKAWINGKNVDRAVGATAGLSAGGLLAYLGWGGSAENTPDSPPKTERTPELRRPVTRIKTNTKAGGNATEKTDTNLNKDGEKSTGIGGWTIFLIILACVVAVVGGVIYCLCFMGNDEDEDVIGELEYAAP